MATDFSAIGEKVKTALAAEEKGIPASNVSTNIKETTRPVEPPRPAMAPAGQKPTEKPATPKLMRVKVDGVEQDVPEEKILEMGQKYYGLEGHFTRQGQELAEERKRLTQEAERIRAEKSQIEQNIKKVLSERDSERYAEERKVQEEREFQELELNDPVQAKLIKANRQLQERINGLETSFKTEVEGLKQFREMSVQERMAERNEQLLGRLSEAANQHAIDQGDIIGYMATHPDQTDPYAVAQKIVERNTALIEEEVRKRLAGNVGPRMNANKGTTPSYTPSGEKPPNMFKERQAFNKILVDILENRENAGQ